MEPQYQVTITRVPVADIAIPYNTRKRVGDLTELKEAIAQVGVQQPIKVRPVPNGNGYELVFGQRRLLSCRELGHEHIPAIIESMTDEQMLEVQLIENSQRADVHPMEEAETLSQLQTAHGKSIEEIAARLGKKRRYILHRLKLLDLIPAAREAFYKNKFGTEVAYLLARIPNPKLQAEALKGLFDRRYGSEPSSAEVARYIRERFMLSIQDAPFDRTDASLVPDAGACGPCPKRTGKSRDLFNDVPERELCTDPACFALKVRANWTRQAEAALAKGWEVLSEEESLTLFPAGMLLHRNSGYIDLDAVHYNDPKCRTWRQLISRADPHITLAQDSFHRTHELVREEEALAALAELGHDFHGPSGTWDNQLQADRRARRHQAALRGAIIRTAIDKVVETALVRPPDEAFWRLILEGFARGSWHEVIVQLVRRRGWHVKEERPEEILLRKIETASVDELRGVMVELIVARGSFLSGLGPLGDSLVKATELYNIDLKEIEATERAKLKLPSRPLSTGATSVSGNNSASVERQS